MEVHTAGERKRKGAAGGGLEWELERQFALERDMLLMAAAAAPGAEQQQQQKQRRRQQQQQHRPFAADLLQNCDLPPPAKLFGPVPTLQRLESAAGTDQKGGDNDSLLRSLRLSQSRAREAEAKLAAAGGQQRGPRGVARAGLGGAVRAPAVGDDAGGRELPAQRRRCWPPRRGTGPGRRRRGGRRAGRARGVRRHRRRRARAGQVPLLNLTHRYPDSVKRKPRIGWLINIVAPSSSGYTSSLEITAG